MYENTSKTIRPATFPEEHDEPLLHAAEGLRSKMLYRVQMTTVHTGVSRSPFRVCRDGCEREPPGGVSDVVIQTYRNLFYSHAPSSMYQHSEYRNDVYAFVVVGYVHRHLDQESCERNAAAVSPIC